MQRPISPVVISVPHAGRVYPLEMADKVRLPLDRLRPLEDRHADLLADQARMRGIATLIAQTPRSWIDLNRSEGDHDPLLVALPPGVRAGSGPKVRAGLGLVPRRLARGGDIWRSSLSLAEVESRIERVHQPWHQALNALILEARRAFGSAILIDLHSMPTPAGADAPQIVVGDLFGRSASGRLTQCALSVVESQGFRAALNAPYAGGYILERHGRPALGIHALQIEVDRALYLDFAHDRPTAKVAHVQQLVVKLADALASELLSAPLPLAAE
jgi:N-formylglutamate amidohydrolase